MRGKIAYFIAIMFSPVLMIITSCGGNESVNLIFNQALSDCATLNQSAATIRCDGGALTFNGSVITPDPCYRLKASLDVVNKSNIAISITAISTPSQDDYCIECAGEILFNGTVSPIGSCSDKVSIVYNGATISEYKRK